MQTIKTTSPLLNQYDQQLIELALVEDLGWPWYDATTEYLLAHTGIAKARVVSKAATPIVLCGLEVVRAVISRLHTGLMTTAKCDMLTNFHDGDIIQPKDELFKLQGPANLLLMAERTILNFLQRLSAIATITHEYVEKVKHTKTKILDTRKTTPGFRHLAKYAVKCGGGENHRLGLYDAIMIKDTHVDVLGGMLAALNKLPENILQTLPVIIEVRNAQELEIVLQHGLHKTTRVLLDNMSLNELRTCVALAKGKISTEASGNVTLETVAAMAETGVDYISVGRLTHSAPNVDLSMQCDIHYD